MLTGDGGTISAWMDCLQQVDRVHKDGPESLQFERTRGGEWRVPADEPALRVCEVVNTVALLMKSMEETELGVPPSFRLNICIAHDLSDMDMLLSPTRESSNIPLLGARGDTRVRPPARFGRSGV